MLPNPAEEVHHSLADKGLGEAEAGHQNRWHGGMLCPHQAATDVSHVLH